MTDKLQEITEKIYNEGILKAREEAERIKEEANTEAKKIIQVAKKQSDEIILLANSEANELKKNAESEMKLAARQFMSQLKQQLTHLILTQQIHSPIQDAFSDNEFIKKIILTIVDNWKPNESGKMDVKILVPKNELNDLSNLLQKRATNAMKNGLEIHVDSKLKIGFKIGPKDDRYVIRFTDVDFENYFKTFFKEKTRKLLFEEK